ncbi:unnamed protein product [Penicillium egyptiacum]|uniref:Zn(2)-C6 fungal-type domain-containing protein n=1 Tax=Penicillium egyptiacum TaxID=1303716 RepID=A0A9W4P1W2_9EURO|nr:unnamed protein product [Penicillium egyptiacum]
MPRRYNVRFAPTTQVSVDKPIACDKCGQYSEIGALPQRSRSGCKDCKRRRVKCDETFPVCLRCQKRGTVCESESSLPQWQLEISPLVSRGITSPSQMRLLRHWCEKASQIMVLDPESNPFSFQILAYLDISPSLMPSILSVSAAHEQFFRKECLETCLEERGKALLLLQKELGGKQPHPTTFFSVFMLGISTPWIDPSSSQFGYEHLTGGRALIELIINSSTNTDRQFAQLALGTYLYWDMACSFLCEPSQQSQISSSIPEAVAKIAGDFHPIMGYSAEIMYTLANLGRYCRSFIELGTRDFALEEESEARLLAWQPTTKCTELMLLGNSFRNHGLINLYRICGRTGGRTEEDLDMGNYPPVQDIETEKIIRQYALQTVRDLSQIPTHNWHTNMQAISLLTAGSELTAYDHRERDIVVGRFNALYSINRLPGNLMAIDILQDVWQARDLEIPTSWVHVMLLRGWRLSLG